MKSLVIALLLSLIGISLQAQVDIIQTAKKAGDSIPEAVLYDIKNQKTSVKTVCANKPTVILFYRAGWCPYCNAHLSEMQEIQKQLISMGYQIIAISTETPESIVETKRKNFTKYAMYSDLDFEAMEAFGIRSGQIAHPACFIVDSKGVIRYAYTNQDYKTRVSKEVVIAEAQKALK
jgi:peroxiredoxin